MNDQTSIKPPVWYWVVAAIALIWNLFGVMAYLGSVYMPPEAMEAMDANRRAFIENTPGWVTGAFAIAVFAGTIGCILLLFRKKLALPFFGASLGGILVQQYYGFFPFQCFRSLWYLRRLGPALISPGYCGITNISSQKCHPKRLDFLTCISPTHLQPEFKQILALFSVAYET